MTKAQAIKLLSKDTSIQEIHRLKDSGLSHTEVTDAIQDAMDMGVEAIQKQIPKKPNIYLNGIEHCPYCEVSVTGMHFDYCVICGQKLDWSEVE